MLGVHPREIEWFDLFLCSNSRVGFWCFWILAWSEYHLICMDWSQERKTDEPVPDWAHGSFAAMASWRLPRGLEILEQPRSSDFSQVIQQLGDDPNASYDLLNVGGGKTHRCPEKTWNQKKRAKGWTGWNTWVLNLGNEVTYDMMTDDWLIIYVASNIQVLQSISGAVPDVFEAK